ncbi:agmatine deiminase family protein [Aliikangiella sp. IMCC44359]|uniref:agmatine deiminase family protein n=1 Tax=Aliikangiella sp. IMCC44359 TaxID=3459125 RepID=UPI00403A7D04
MNIPLKRWPAEWEKHQSTWMIYPCRTEVWTNGIDTAQQAFAQVVNQISEYEKVNLLILKEHIASAQKKLSGAVEIFETSLDDSWARDTGPIWIKEGEALTALDFQFNAWGNKFDSHQNDQAIAKFITKNSQSSYQKIDMVLEGGSVHSNGQGILLTTKECLLNQNRNPLLTQYEIEKNLKNALGAEQVIWLEKGIVGDLDTDGHIDNIACFIDQGTVLTQTAENNSENFDIYQQNKQIILSHSLELIEIPEPQPRYNHGLRLPLSYVNFYILNGAIIMPQFGCSQDDIAFQTIKDFYSDRTVHAIDANEILIGGGGIHCITMQEPAL